MTNEAAITRITEKLKTVRRNNDSTPNGNAIHGYYKSLRTTMMANGMNHTEAYRTAWFTIQTLVKAL